MHQNSNKPAGSIECVLILDFLALPAEQQAVVKAFPGFGNNRFLEYVSTDFGPEPGQTWAAGFVSSAMQNCLADAQARGFDRGLQSYIEQHDSFLGWLVKQGFDLNVAKILVQVVW